MFNQRLIDLLIFLLEDLNILVEGRGAASSSFRGGAIFMKFQPMTSSCLFNRCTTFSLTVTDKVPFAAFPKMRTFQFYQDADRTIWTK